MGAGGLTVGLPLLRTFIDPRQARAQEDAGWLPKRVIGFSYPMGTIRSLFTPTATGTSWEFGPVTEAMTPFQDRTMVVTRLSNAILELTGGTAGHEGKQESVFTGTLMTNAFSGDGSSHVDNVIASSSPNGLDSIPNGPSIEHVIGQWLQGPQHLRPSVDLGIASTAGWNKLTTASKFFYEAAENPVTLNHHPQQTLDLMFQGVTTSDGAPDEALLALRRRRKSVLDGVREAFVDLRQGLPAADRAVLDDHADKIRQIELDMPVPASCTIPDGIPTSDDAFSGYEGYAMSEFADLQIRILAHAMACDVAPVGRLDFGRQQNPLFGIPLVDDAVAAEGWHDPIVHKANGWDPEDPVRIAGFSFYVEKFAALLAELDAIPEGPDGRTALDNSLLFLGSDLGDGDGHRARDLSFLVAGGSELGAWGTHIDGEGYNTNQLLTTLLHLAGVENDDGSVPMEFGLQGFTSGPIDALLS